MSLRVLNESLNTPVYTPVYTRSHLHMCVYLTTTATAEGEELRDLAPQLFTTVPKNNKIKSLKVLLKISFFVFCSGTSTLFYDWPENSSRRRKHTNLEQSTRQLYKTGLFFN
jgi:hypothetical protein